MQIDEKDKANILLNLLKERYEASHKMRERSLKFTIWILGFAIAIVWILLNGVSLTLHQKWILTSLIIIIGGITFWFLYAVERGFNKNRKVMIDLEEVLGCYKEGVYIDSKALFPKEYKEIKKKSLIAHFTSMYVLIFPIALIIILLIWLGPTQQHQKEARTPLENQKIEQIDKNVNR